MGVNWSICYQAYQEHCGFTVAITLNVHGIGGLDRVYTVADSQWSFSWECIFGLGFDSINEAWRSTALFIMYPNKTLHHTINLSEFRPHQHIWLSAFLLREEQVRFWSTPGNVGERQHLWRFLLWSLQELQQPPLDQLLLIHCWSQWQILWGP